MGEWAGAGNGRRRDDLQQTTRSRKESAMPTPFYENAQSPLRAGKDRARPSAHEVGVEPSGPKGDNPATAGPGKTEVASKTPENAKGHINPSAPEDANVTPGSIGRK